MDGLQSQQQSAGVTDAGELKRVDTELGGEEERLSALNARRDDLMQRRATALADKQRCGERCVNCCGALSFFISLVCTKALLGQNLSRHQCMSVHACWPSMLPFCA